MSKVLRQKEKFLLQDTGSKSPSKRSKPQSPTLERTLAVWAKNQVCTENILIENMRLTIDSAQEGCLTLGRHDYRPSARFPRNSYQLRKPTSFEQRLARKVQAQEQSHGPSIGERISWPRRHRVFHGRLLNTKSARKSSNLPTTSPISFAQVSVGRQEPGESRRARRARVVQSDYTISSVSHL